MTKKEIILKIQRTEAAAWKELRECEHVYGKMEPITSRKRSEWGAIYNLMESLGLESLPTQQLFEEGFLPTK